MTGPEELRRENDELRARLRDSEELIRAIHAGEVDAVIVQSPQGEQVFTLAGAERPYRLFVDAMNEGAAILGDDRTVLYANRAFGQIVSARPEEIVGRSLDTFLRAPDGQRLEVPSDASMEGEVVTGDGRRLVVALSDQPVDFDGRSFTALVLTDLTGQRLHERLRASEERLRLATQAAGIGTFEVDLSQGVVHCAGRAAEMFGHPGQTGLAFGDVVDGVHPEDRPRLQEAIKAALASSGPGHLREEVRLVHPDGAVRWHEITTQTVFEDTGAGPMPRRMIGAIVDTTERNAREAALRESEGRFRHMADQTPIIVWVTDPAGGIEFVNRSYCEFFGTSLEDTLGPTWMPRIHPEDRAYTEAFFGALRARSEFHANARVRNAAGEWRWLESVGTPRYSAQRAFIGMIGTSRDVTDERRMSQLEREAARQKDEFIAVLAHELRNPLAPIRTAVGLLRSPGIPTPLLTRCRDIIDRQVAQMARLLDDLLDVSRLSRGQLTLRRAPARLADIIDAAIETARPLVDARSHVLSVDEVDRNVTLDADATRLTQVFANLLNNAAKYTDPGGVIRLTFNRQGDHVAVAVQDSGVGIDADMRERIFELFAQAADSRGRADGGIGIGLGLARRLVEMHGGTIQVASAGRGRGSIFTVTLPVGVQHTEPRPAAESPAGDEPAARRVLVADDNVDAADTMALFLGTVGCEVRTVYDGRSAVLEAQAFKPDLLLLDLGMPGVSGQAACRQIRAETWSNRTVIAAVTGWAQEEDRRQTALAGFDHHLTKPVDPETLLRLVRDLQPRTRQGSDNGH